MLANHSGNTFVACSGHRAHGLCNLHSDWVKRASGGRENEREGLEGEAHQGEMRKRGRVSQGMVEGKDAAEGEQVEGGEIEGR